jgi:hypothetical protein
MITAQQIVPDANIATLSSFLKSSSLSELYKVTLDQINLLEFAIPEIYA